MDIYPGIVHEQGVVANPGPLGLCATAIANWSVAVANVGWTVPDQSIGVSVFYGGLAQFVAGLWCFRRRETLGALAFCTYGAWWIGLVVFGILFTSKDTQFFKAFDDPAKQLPDAIAWYTVCILISNTYMLICSIQGNPVGVANFFWLELSEILLVIGQFKREALGAGCIKAGGAVQIILAIFCFYSAFAQTWNDMSGRDMIPLGPPLVNLKKKD